MIEGSFVVIEGIDGVGKSTQARLLRDALRAAGQATKLTQQPSDGPIGAMLRQILSGRVVVQGLQGPRPPSWNTMAALFAADRLDHLEAEILPNLHDGVTVICDRYDHSSVAFQSVSAGEDAKVVAWLQQLNRYARRPDLTVVLDAPADLGRQRRIERGEAVSIYEGDELQQQLARFYRDIERYFPADRIVHVDASRTPEAISVDVLRHVQRLRLP